MDCLITCEHASNHIPQRWRKYFRHSQRLLGSHAGYDIGAAYMARCLARQFHTTPYMGTVSRLLVDLNRSTHHPKLFSKAIKNLGNDTRSLIVSRYYHPYRQAVIDAVEASHSGGTLVHFSVHSFVPQWGGTIRPVDLGLLYDPTRATEVLLCRRIKEHLQAIVPGLRLRRNYPYRGDADGHTSALRKRYPAQRYAGIELEFNQRLLAGPVARRRALCAQVTEAIRYSLDTDAGA